MNSDNTESRNFFVELSKKNDVRIVGEFFKNIYGLIQKRKELLSGQTENAAKNLADIKAKTVGFHNWLLYNYGDGSLADHHLEIVQKIMEGNIEELNSIENVVHISNQSRGIREVDELLSNILYGNPKSSHSENIPVKVGDITGVNIYLNKNKVTQNNLTKPDNPLKVIQQGIQMTPVINPRRLTLVEQMNGEENMFMNILNKGKKYKTERQKVTIHSIEPLRR